MFLMILLRVFSSILLSTVTWGENFKAVSRYLKYKKTIIDKRIIKIKEVIKKDFLIINDKGFSIFNSILKIFLI